MESPPTQRAGRADASWAATVPTVVSMARATKRFIGRASVVTRR